MVAKTKKKPCGKVLTKDAAEVYGSRTCQAQYPHKHCKECGFPFSQDVPSEYCGSCNPLYS